MYPHIDIFQRKAVLVKSLIFRAYKREEFFCLFACLSLGQKGVFILFFSFIFISCRLITLQYCSGFCHTLTWISHGFTCVPHPELPLPPPSPSHPSGSSQCTSPEHSSHASNLDWRSVSHVIIYMFQCQFSQKDVFITH